jgi:protein tyrosine phosphatase
MSAVSIFPIFLTQFVTFSYFQGYFIAKEYIAAQGPKPNTSHDFWRMVLQHKTESIVMLTSLVENNKVKCHEYFPKLNGRVTFDNIKIECINEHQHPNYVKRILAVEKVYSYDIM